MNLNSDQHFEQPDYKKCRKEIFIHFEEKGHYSHLEEDVQTFLIHLINPFKKYQGTKNNLKIHDSSNFHD